MHPQDRGSCKLAALLHGDVDGVDIGEANQDGRRAHRPQAAGPRCIVTILLLLLCEVLYGTVQWKATAACVPMIPSTTCFIIRHATAAGTRLPARHPSFTQVPSIPDGRQRF